MSQPSRPQARGPAQRRRRDLRLEEIVSLEERCLLTPVLTLTPRLAAFTAAATLPTGVNTGGVVVTLGQPDAGFLTAAPLTSVTQLTPLTAFGGDIVRIRSGPGGDFGKGIYAISRGAGRNGLAADDPLLANDSPRTITNAINRPGVIYRVDPATGKSSVFFDLNTVVPQLNPGATPGNSVGTSTGLVNWYDMAFDPEGYFDGRPSMFVASVDRSDPAKNAIYRIGPDGTFLGAFVQVTDGLSALKFNANPTAVVVPPPEDQSFLRGLLSGAPQSTFGTTTNTQLAALFFNANAFTPGQNLGNLNNLPVGVTQTALTLGPITGLTAANPDYLSRVYSTFTDFGTPTGGGIPGVPGFSGIQGLNGELLINGGGFPANAVTTTDSTITDKYPVADTDFRRFEDISFDQYGYFAQGVNVGVTVTGTGTGGTGGGGTGTGTGTGNGVGSVGGTGAGGGSGGGVGQTLGAGIGGLVVVSGTVTLAAGALPPANAGNVFATDLGTGLSVPLVIPQSNPAVTIRVPVQGPEIATVLANGTTSIEPLGPGLGGRVVRITPDGTVRTFADNFNTSNLLDSRGFALSSLSLTFSADGTTLYVADDDAIWQFKTVASLAGSTGGSIVGLNDLRSLGVPYEGQSSAVAVLDTGVDANSTPFRGRVSRGTNIVTNGPGSTDTAIFSTGTTTGGGAGGGTGGGAGGGAGGNTGGGNTATPTLTDGHGTPIAGIIAQFVPQATIVPVNIFAPFIAVSLSVTNTGNGTGGGGIGGGGGGGGGGAGGAGGTGGSATGNSNALSTSNNLYLGLDYIAKRPFVNDPVRPGQVDRVIATAMGFGTTETFDAEGIAYRRYPQIVITLKDQLKKFRHLGIQPIAASGQLGAPLGATAPNANGGGGGVGGGGGGGAGGAGGTGTTLGGARNNAANRSVGDVNGLSLPAILNEVISVTGTYPFPFVTGPGTPPTDPTAGVFPFPVSPVLVPITPGTGGTTTTGGGGTGGGGAGGGTGNGTTGNLLVNTLTNADIQFYSDRVLGSSNRNITTDFAAPAVDVPTFRRIFIATGTTGTGGTGGAGGTGAGTGGTGNIGSNFLGIAGNGYNYNTDQFAGTSASAAMVTGAYALVSSALNYWAVQNITGTTADAYLTQPVGARTLNFGPHAFKDLTAYNNPDGINAILQWTAVPVSDPNDGLSGSAPLAAIGSPNFRNYSRLSVGNAVAAIETSVALQWLMDHNYLDKLADGSGMITAQTVQNFVDTASKAGVPEAGAMARLLGGTARPPVSPGSSGFTLALEQPDQPDVLQRRFNFLDYAAHGTLNGGISVTEARMLAHTLLPLPDSFVVNDRQRASANGYLLDPTAKRNYTDLQHIQPTYQFISKKQLFHSRYQNISPAKFHVDRNITPGTTFPLFTLFDTPIRRKTSGGVTIGSTGSGTSTSTGTTATGSTGNGAAATAATSATPRVLVGASGSVTSGSAAAVSTTSTATGAATTTSPTTTGTTTQIASLTTLPVLPATASQQTQAPSTTAAFATSVTPSATDPVYAATLAQHADKKGAFSGFTSTFKKLF